MVLPMHVVIFSFQLCQAGQNLSRVDLAGQYDHLMALLISYPSISRLLNLGQLATWSVGDKLLSAIIDHY